MKDYIFIPLKTEFFNSFKSGTKNAEYRKVSKLYNKDRVIVGKRVKLALGYTSEASKVLWGVVTSVNQEFRSCESWLKCYKKPGECLVIGIKLDA